MHEILEFDISIWITHFAHGEMSEISFLRLWVSETWVDEIDMSISSIFGFLASTPCWGGHGPGGVEFLEASADWKRLRECMFRRGLTAGLCIGICTAFSPSALLPRLQSTNRLVVGSVFLLLSPRTSSLSPSVTTTTMNSNTLRESEGKVRVQTCTYT